MKPDIQLYPQDPTEDDEDFVNRVSPMRIAVAAVACLLAVVIAGILLALSCSKAHGSVFRTHAEAALRDPDLPQVKRELFREGLNAGWPERECSVSYYHPREAGSAWDDWTGTRTGTLVRPGVASCTIGSWRRWGGAHLWVSGYGVCRVEDCFPEGKSQYWFDLAVPGPPERYTEWLASRWLAQVAKTFGKQPATFVVLKPKGGWKQKTGE